jgi:hypothetical protein
MSNPAEAATQRMAPLLAVVLLGLWAAGTVTSEQSRRCLGLLVAAVRQACRWTSRLVAAYLFSKESRGLRRQT